MYSMSPEYLVVPKINCDPVQGLQELKDSRCSMRDYMNTKMDNDGVRLSHIFLKIHESAVIFRERAGGHSSSSRWRKKRMNHHHFQPPLWYLIQASLAADGSASGPLSRGQAYVRIPQTTS